MRTILTALFILFSSMSGNAQTVFDPEAYGREPYAAYTDTALYLLCGPNYMNSLPDASIGYPIEAAPREGMLTFRVVASGFNHPVNQVALTGPYRNLVADIAAEGNLFAVFEPVRGSTTTALVTIHGRVDGACAVLNPPQVIGHPQNFPDLVNQMIRHLGNR